MYINDLTSIAWHQLQLESHLMHINEPFNNWLCSNRSSISFFEVPLMLPSLSSSSLSSSPSSSSSSLSSPSSSLDWFYSTSRSSWTTRTLQWEGVLTSTTRRTSSGCPSRWQGTCRRWWDLMMIVMMMNMNMIWWWLWWWWWWWWWW